MDDTPIEMYRLQVRIWQAKSFQDRMRLGCAADAMGLRAAAALAARQNDRDPAALFLSLHGQSFDAAERETIAAAIRARCSATTS